MGIYDYYKEIEKPCAAIFSEMSSRGVCVDLRYLEELKSELEAQKSPIEEAIKDSLGSINLNSPKQLLTALNEKEIYPELKGKPSTDKRAIQTYAHVPLVQNLLQYGELETLLSSFVIPYLTRACEVVHPFFNQCGTRTGRPSCSNPNLLQIPRKTENGRIVRNMFTARRGLDLGESDYSAIEPRVLAHLSKDDNLCDLFNGSTDLHTWTSQRLNISRERAKVLNLSVGYRATFKSVMTQLSCDKYEAQRQIDSWWQLFPKLRMWQEKLIYTSKRSGYCTTLMGRRIRVDRLDSPLSWERESAERQLINNITQGSAAEIMKKAMIQIYNDPRLSKTFGLLIQIYDSLVFESAEIQKDVGFVIEGMENSSSLDVPLKVELKTGIRWGDLK